MRDEDKIWAFGIVVAAATFVLWKTVESVLSAMREDDQ